MYCPKCGQQQVTDYTRFCSRCGLQITGLLEWLQSDGAVAVLEAERPPASVSQRRKGIRLGAKVLFLSVVLSPIALALSFLVDAPIPLLFPLTVFLVGLCLIVYAVIFSEEAPPAKTHPSRPARLGSTFTGAALPPAGTWPHTVADERARTAELAQPPSVTENTTRLLDND